MSEGSGSLWTYVRGKLLPPGIHATRVENGVSAGFPDVHYLYRRENGTRTTGTIELKFLRKKQPPFGDEGLNRDQKIWIRDEIEAGGQVWILADIGGEICLVRGKFAPVFNSWAGDDFMRQSTLIFRKRKITRDDLDNFAILL